MYASIAFVAMLLPRKASVTLSGTKENHDHYTLHVHMPGRVTCKTVIVIKSMIHIGFFSEINREVFHEGWELKKAKVRGSPDPPSGHTCPWTSQKKHAIMGIVPGTTERVDQEKTEKRLVPIKSLQSSSLTVLIIWQQTCDMHFV